MHYKTIFNTAVAVSVVAIFSIGCSEKPDEDDGGGGGKGNDISKYRTVTIGTQRWMAENLDYAMGDSRCLAHNPSYCATYGRLYSWDDAKRACPSGWHLPTDAEWTTLTEFVGGESTAGTKLKSSTGWNSYSGVPIGTNEYGFSALPGGYGFGSCNGCAAPPADQSAGGYGIWWSDTEYDASYAWSRNMTGYGAIVNRDSSSKYGLLFSVRCVQD